MLVMNKAGKGFYAVAFGELHTRLQAPCEITDDMHFAYVPYHVNDFCERWNAWIAGKFTVEEAFPDCDADEICFILDGFSPKGFRNVTSRNYPPARCSSDDGQADECAS